MATPRKHWFRVADSILREPWPRDVKLTMVLLSAWLNQRWARDGLDPDQTTLAVLSPAALAEITGRTQLAHARRAMRALGERVTIAISVRGEFTEISWPKFAEFQGLTARESPESRPRASPSVPPPPPPPQKKSRSARARGALTDPPESLEIDALRKLQAWAASEHAELQAHVPELVATCLDHFRGKGERRADWIATCRTWIRNEARFVRERRTTNHGAHRPTLADASAEVLAAIRSRRVAP